MVKEEQQADTILLAVQAAQTEAEIRNAAIRQAERQAKMDAWKDPEAMQMRHATHIKGSIESLWALRENGECAADAYMPIPPQEELPKELRGQAPSYVRSMLRGNADWKKKVEAHKLLEEEKHKLRGKHPELWGINFSKVRQENPVEMGDEHKVRTGKTLKVSEASPTGIELFGIAARQAAAIAETKKPGLVARIFAGLKRE